MLQVREEHILEVLCAADMYLLPGLKRGCGAVLGSCLSTDNVVSRLKTARLFQLPHLEDQCTQFISVHIDKVVKYLCVCAWVGGGRAGPCVWFTLQYLAIFPLYWHTRI